MKYTTDFEIIDKTIDGKISNEIYSNYDKLYLSTNEELIEPYKKIKFKDKKVLSVCASGDQALLALNKGASNVDLFDTNILSYYYFYLKKWVYNKYGYFSKELFTSTNILNLLSEIVSSNDEEINAILFWNIYFRKYNDLTPITRVYLREKYSFKNTRINIPDSINFYQMNLFDKNLNMPNEKYDIVIVSNILECTNDADEIISARENLYNLTNPNGIVLCSNLLGEDGNFVNQNGRVVRIDRLMKDKFNLEVIKSRIANSDRSYNSSSLNTTFKYIRKI